MINFSANVLNFTKLRGFCPGLTNMLYYDIVIKIQFIEEEKILNDNQKLKEIVANIKTLPAYLNPKAEIAIDYCAVGLDERIWITFVVPHRNDNCNFVHSLEMNVAICASITDEEKNIIATQVAEIMYKYSLNCDEITNIDPEELTYCLKLK